MSVKLTQPLQLYHLCRNPLPLTVGYTQICGAGTTDGSLSSDMGIVCVDYSFWETFKADSAIYIWGIFSLLMYILVCIHLLLVVFLNTFPNNELSNMIRKPGGGLNKSLMLVTVVVFFSSAAMIAITFWLAFDSTENSLADDKLKSDEEDASNYKEVNKFFTKGVTSHSESGLSVLGGFALAAYFLEMYAAYYTHYFLRKGKEQGAGFWGYVSPDETLNTNIGGTKDVFSLEDVKSGDGQSPPQVKVVSAFANKRAINGMKF